MRLYLVNDRSLNAFVTGGQKMFIHTGLLMRAETANQVIGVIAHETGHIAGGHLVRTSDAIASAESISMLGYILGGAAGLATGRPDVGAAIALGTQSAGVRNFLKYSRTQEGAADHAALRYLDDTGQSSKGLLEFMEILGDQELLSPARQDAYVRTHPLSRDRVNAIRAHVETSSFASAPPSPELELRHRRMQAKLRAFLEPPALTFRRYKETDRSIPARYARAIANFKRAEMDAALGLLDGLLAENPRDGYFHATKGEVLFKSGRIDEALKSYRIAGHLLPGSPVLRREIGRAQIESGKDELLDEAIKNLNAALHYNPSSASAWRSLAIAYGRKGDMGMSALAMAEEAAIRGDRKAARYHAGKAQTLLKRGSRGWVMAQDIMEATNEDDEDKEN